jgi:hypothetical protein
LYALDITKQHKWMTLGVEMEVAVAVVVLWWRLWLSVVLVGVVVLVAMVAMVALVAVVAVVAVVGYSSWLQCGWFSGW